MKRSFEEIMQDWDETTEYSDICKLPILAGTSNKGYMIIDVTFIDKCWYPYCKKLLWTKRPQGYVVASFSKNNMKRLGVSHLYKPVKDREYKYLFLHRLVTGIANSCPRIVDHKDYDKLNNINDNLRVCTEKDNSANVRKKSSTSSRRSKYIGVDINPNTGRCRARLFRKGTSKTIGWFDTEKQAAKAYDRYLRDTYPSEFNVYNFKE